MPLEGYDPNEPGGGGGGSSSSSDSGSSSSSGPSAPKVNQYLSDEVPGDPVARRKAMQFASIYEALWGEPATEAYLLHAAQSGLNSYEFALNERQKPAWLQTKAFKDQFAGGANLLKQLGI